jgi:hypothetical protein
MTRRLSDRTLMYRNALTVALRTSRRPLTATELVEHMPWRTDSTLSTDPTDAGGQCRTGTLRWREIIRSPKGNVMSRSERRQRTELLVLRLLPNEHAVLHRVAAAKGVSISKFVRDVLLAELAKNSATQEASVEVAT